MKQFLLAVIASLGILVGSGSIVHANTGNFVSVSGDKFYLNGQPFYPYGTNYYPSYYNVPNFQIPAKDNRNQSFLSSPYYEDHTALLEKELQDLQDIGFNSISFSLPHKNIPNGKSNLSDFLLRLNNHNLKASVFIPACDPLSVGQNVQRSFKIDECLGYIRDYSLSSNATIISYEIAWEPSWEDYNSRKNITILKNAWANWIKERYESEDYAGKSWGYTDYSLPSDTEMTTDGPWINKSKAYRRFLIDYVSKQYGEVVRQIKMIDSNHLVSARTGYTAGYMSLSIMTGAAKVFDFIGLEGWTLPNPSDSDVSLFGGNGFAVAYAKAVSGGKPVFFYEFGMDTLSDNCHSKDEYFDQNCYKDNSQEKMNSQFLYYRHFLDMAIRSGASGVMNWMYVGKRPYKNFAYGDTEVSDYGIREVPANDSGNELGNVKPVYGLVKQYASLFTINRHDAPYSGSISIDPDSFVTESEFWKKGGNEFAAALLKNQFPTYTTLGTGTNSTNTPMVCTGNIPYNHACPLKYLNSKFNYIEIQNANGEWQVITNGTNVNIAIGAPITGRASIKNTGESSWLAKTSDQRGKIQIGGNENVGSLNFRANIPNDTNPNNDVVIESFNISPKIDVEKKLVFQMSSNAIAWFGERVEVKLIPVVSTVSTNNVVEKNTAQPTSTPEYSATNPILVNEKNPSIPTAISEAINKQSQFSIRLVLLIIAVLGLVAIAILLTIILVIRHKIRRNGDNSMTLPLQLPSTDKIPTINSEATINQNEIKPENL